MRKRRRGFSLIELLIVVAIILIIAAIAIPNLMHTKSTANETAAIGNLRALNNACMVYSVTYGVGFPAALANLGGATGAAASSTSADLIDTVLAGGTKTGYKFTYVPGPVTNGTIFTYTINADPIQPGQTGTRYFFTDQSTTIRQNFGAPAAASSPPIG